SCHHPHASEVRPFLRAQVRPLCATCHAEVEEQLATQTAHGPAASPDGCTSCHGPHMTRNPDLLARPVAETCATCHDVENAEFLARHLGLPAAALDCGSCHDPHASQMAGMLLPEVHPPFAEGDCTVCHTAVPRAGGER
ncbi:MAG TPA: cytochrome c3 family protein, partial [Thermoanaerobaculia bacterium]|nr:cytochrome c3 family protein [Thermoanaerobaculia bacterium]